jgi:LmbE family N-acetylglucosaminyl deacetylase
MSSRRYLISIAVLVGLLCIGISLMSAQGKAKPRKCILVFGAHADDVDEIAGGTLAKYTANGYEGIYIGVTNNLAGCNLEKAPGDRTGPKFTSSNSPKTYPVEALETNQIRTEEAKAAAAVYGATAIFLDFCEPEIWEGRKLVIFGTEEFVHFDPPMQAGKRDVSLATRYSADVDVVVNLLKKYQPEIVIIHTLGGEKLDHGNAAYLMYLAFEKAHSKGIPLGKLWMKVDGWFLEDAAQESGRGKPDVHVDVKNYLKTKYEALNKHISQNGGFGREYVKRNQTQPKEVIEEFITVLDYTR